MPPPAFRPGRPRLTLALLGYAFADVIGLVLISLGGTWFMSGRPLFLPSFPATTFEAVICIGIGLAVMFWAVARLLQTMAAQNLSRQPEPGADND